MASPPIRARATLAGNIANASPVADMTAMLLALGARLRLKSRHGEETREVALQDFFIGYKKTAASDDERIDAIILPDAQFAQANRLREGGQAGAAGYRRGQHRDGLPSGGTRRRAGRARRAHLCGGRGADPAVSWTEASAFAEGKTVNAALVREAARLAAAGTSPMSDARGSSAYRKTMVERLVIAHFLRLFPELKLEEELFA